MQFKILVGCTVLLALVCTAIYGHTLDISWYLDDLPGIVENPLVRSIPDSLSAIFQPRGLTTLTFALNYHFGLLGLSGYHFANILLHFVVSCLVFLLIYNVCAFKWWVALCGALLFVVHPVQTQAVNYLVQRSTLLAALFVLLSILFFFAAEKLRSCEKTGDNLWRYRILVLAALFFGAWAVLTKQNAATLPLLLFILGYYRQLVSSRTLALRVAPFFIAPAVVVVVMVVLPMMGGEELARVASTRQLVNLDGVTPLQYFVTELSVLPLYLKLLLFPSALRLDYAYPVTAHLFSVVNVLLFCGHLAVLVLALHYRQRFRTLAFAILWFYVALMVESTFIPLDPIFEHRLYLPIIGPIILFCALFERVIRKTRLVVVGVVLLLLIFGYLSWQRNELWRQPVAFAEDNARKSSHAEGPWVALSGRYLEVGRLLEARQALDRALKINPEYTRIYINLSSVSLQEGDYAGAQVAALSGLRRDPGNEKLQRNLAISYLQGGERSRGVALLDGLARRHPEDYSLRVLIAQSAFDQKEWSVAEKWLKNAVAIGTDGDHVPYYLLGVVFYEQKNLSAAAESLRRALQLKNTDVAIVRGLGLILLELGDFQGAREQLRKLETLDQGAAESLRATIRSVTTSRTDDIP